MKIQGLKDAHVICYNSNTHTAERETYFKL